MSQPLIVLTADFSAESMRAFAPTADLARRLGARIALVHVVPELLLLPFAEVFMPPQSAVTWANQVDRARERLQELRARLPEDLDVTCEVLSGESAEKEIVEYAAEQKAMFLAMATHGRTGLRRAALGSVCEAVLRHTTTPLVIFPRGP